LVEAVFVDRGPLVLSFFKDDISFTAGCWSWLKNAIQSPGSGLDFSIMQVFCM
jgi:hypothetical protein